MLSFAYLVHTNYFEKSNPSFLSHFAYKQFA